MRHREATEGTQSRTMLHDAERLLVVADEPLPAIDCRYGRGWTAGAGGRAVAGLAGACGRSAGHFRDGLTDSPQPGFKPDHSTGPVSTAPGDTARDPCLAKLKLGEPDD